MNGVLLKVMNKRKRRATVGLLADAKLLAAFHTSRARYSLCRKLEALYQTNHGNAVYIALAQARPTLSMYNHLGVVQNLYLYMTAKNISLKFQRSTLVIIGIVHYIHTCF